jgi:NodT family efflux transporter outer membrane factor (OMF) lipoprotein
MKYLPRAFLTALAVSHIGCNFTPKHQAPEMAIPAHFKEGQGWKVAKPAAQVPHGEWWGIFHDSELSAILQAVDVSNQSLQSAIASAEQTAALVRGARLAFYPTAGIGLSSTRSRSGSSGGSANTNSLASRGGSGVQTIHSVTGTSSWEADLWGRLRHGAGAAKADLQAAQANVESTRLSLQTQAAQTYFQLRAADAQKHLLEGEVANYQKSLDLTENREAQGVASGADIAQAQTQLATARAALIELDVQRATLEHALATLSGRVPAAFDVRKGVLAATVPALPATAPASLLERRPDIAAGERRVAAANERIGAARAAFFPTLVLSADTGWRGLSDLFAKSNNFWSLGADMVGTILDSGKRVAAKAQADATWKQTVADYRQTVLTAMQETEDALATLRILALESTAQADAVRAARESERIATNQYKAGTLSYINVATAQATALAAERNSITLQSRRLDATVALIKALGGNW